MSRPITSNPDKTRILTLLLNKAYSSMLYDSEWLREQRDNQPPIFCIPGLHLSNNKNAIKVGDLVTGQTSIGYNDYLVGFVKEIHDDCLLIREIGTDRTCYYSNERFLRIDKDLIGYEILEGREYEVYQKVLKAFSGIFAYRFGGIDISGNWVTVKARKVFSDETAFTFEFRYNKKTSIKSINNMIHEQIIMLEGFKTKEGETDVNDS